MPKAGCINDREDKMTETYQGVNTIAPLKNVARFSELLYMLVNREPELPGFGTFSGRAGLGKTFAAMYGINEYRAFYVECGFTWTQKAFVEAVMVECGLLPPRAVLKKPIYRAVEEIGDHLADHPRRPLIIDEADFLVKRGMIEIVRDIYKVCAASGSAIVLIGEENMPNALKMWERIDSRVLKNAPAEETDNEDVQHLSKLVCPQLKLEGAVIEKLRRCTNGSARRVVAKLYGLREHAALSGLSQISLNDWDPAEA
jgi:hypothetical protein